ncbi:hypothetical protein JL721_2963 [Aureococcus anophagefferens]|nr:hypothetical protein JL721_2963 [Aureococcus anophagefferens]KAH8097867.1 hypothetical protein JL720_785 [Aureococcus anophagefferens]
MARRSFGVVAAALLVAQACGLVARTLPRAAPVRRTAARAAPTAFFQQFLPNPEADAALDGFVSGSKAVLFSDGSAASQSAIEALKVSKTTKYTERRIGVSPPALIVNGAVFDAKRIDYLVKQDMMLPVFRAAGTSGEIRLPFQDLRFYLAKTIN